jgi:hypothetical protein
LEVELISGVIYVNGSVSALESALQITAAQAAPAASKWITVMPTDAPFQLLAQTLTMSSTLSEFTPTAHLRLGREQTVGHVKAIPIMGTPATTQKGTSGSCALLVSTKGSHLPVGGTLILANKTGRLTEVAVFTSWGARVSLATPTGGVAFSSLLTS